MKLKKMSACLLAVLAVIFSLPLGASALSEEEVKAPSAVLMEAQTGKVLYEKDDHEQRACASITKVMTLLLVMEALDSGKIGLNDTVTASEHAASMGGSDIWLEPGESMTVDDMLKATVISSANDAAVALAEYVAGSEDEFVAQMNQRAKELGMKDTVFKNVNGLDEDGHVTSAYDVALMSKELIKHQKIYDYTKTWMDNVRGGKTQLVNTNKLLKSYKGITGLKTGTTGKAGSCISATAQRDGVSLVAVVLGSSSTTDRFNAAATLMDYGFANWSVVNPKIPSEANVPVPVENGMEENVEPSVNGEESLLVPKGKAGDVTSKVLMNNEVRAPVEEGQTLGKITYSLNGEVLKETKITAKKAVEPITFSSAFRLLMRMVMMDP
ncbi:D-alanyl-D-alanine carboxypeptidase [Caproiciproducens sp. NJN-50]|uniref:D-alanyl-D-alanine carboxypeptidase family protein n=1 Tax=Acutalibacteraceae TaxID=3082771 RepID=UPI000FFE2421|nr:MULTISPECIES: D-alanyl-D-alanine carboxypeptidase family protein [Acutalibacteraceae]QAT49401.1 D-alanyl-D-alanine carboxypeptidase [Caproiciproducens sp. NJN-50]